MNQNTACAVFFVALASGRATMTFVDAQTPKRKSILTITPAKTPQNLAKDHG